MQILGIGDLVLSEAAMAEIFAAQDRLTGTFTPASPWMGSTKNAQVFFVTALSNAAASP